MQTLLNALMDDKTHSVEVVFCQAEQYKALCSTRKDFSLDTERLEGCGLRVTVFQGVINDVSVRTCSRELCRVNGPHTPNLFLPTSILHSYHMS